MFRWTFSRSRAVWAQPIRLEASVSGKTVLYVAVISLAVVVAYERYGHNAPRIHVGH